MKKHPNENIIYDPRLTWNTEDMVQQASGNAIMSKTGHAFIKETMREKNAIYGGEMSAHHYFRDFAYCDSGMIPWLLVVQLLSDTGNTLKSMVEQRMSLFPCSGEINFKVADVPAVLSKIQQQYAPNAISIETIDGVGMDMGAWRFNVRSSNTEPLVRLNVESKANQSLMLEKTRKLSALIQDN